MHTSSFAGKKTFAVATHGKHHHGISKARQMVLASLSGIPSFDSSTTSCVKMPSSNFGAGQFGEIKLIKLDHLDIIAAGKVCNSSASKKAIDIETIIGMTVSGHFHFPYVYGLLNSRTILMQFFGKLNEGTWSVSPNFAQMVAKKPPANDIRNLCKGIFDGFNFLHSKSILHNDIKADNIVIHNNFPKIIDFGKANSISSSGV